MVTGKPQQGVVAAAEPGVARRLWRVVRAVLYMLRRGVPSSGRKLAMDLHLLLRRGKIAGKALGGLFLAAHHNNSHARHAAAAFSHAGAGAGPFSCRALDPSLAVHEPSRGRREVEFSCSNTPSSATGRGGALGLLGAAKRRRRRNRQHHQQRDEAAAASSGYLQYYNYQDDDAPGYSYDYDAAEVARVFDMLNDGGSDDDAAPLACSVTPSPAQAHLLYLQAAVGGSRQARVAASPAPADGAHMQQVDRQADEFIRRFYEQLRAQRSAASTPDYYGTARPVTAGIA